METVKNQQDIETIKENQILGQVNLDKSTIEFKGKGNILLCSGNVTLSNSSLRFNGDNSLIILNSNWHPYLISATVHHNSVLYFGKNIYFNGTFLIILSEEKNMLMGDACLLSFGNHVRTADPHLIYDCSSKRRLNPSKSIYIGDHVWIGQNCTILKGAKIGSGSIIGANSVVSGKTLQSNCSYGGNPVKKIRENVFFTGACVHMYQEKETLQSEFLDSDEFIYSYQPREQISFDTIEQSLNHLPTAEQKMEYLKQLLMTTSRKNRFFIAESPTV